MRTLLPLSLGLLAMGLACAGTEDSSASSPAEEAPPVDAQPLQTDLDALARLVTLPPEATSCRFRYGPRGKAGGLGPTDYELSAWVALSGTDSLDELYGAPRKTRGPATLPAAEAQLLPDEVRSGLPAGPDGGVLLEGTYRRPSGPTGGMHLGGVHEVGEQGIFLTAFTM